MVTHFSESKPAIKSTNSSNQRLHSRRSVAKQSVKPSIKPDLDDDDFAAYTPTSSHQLDQNETTAIHYQITHDGPNFNKLSLHPLRSQFAEFAELRPPNKAAEDNSNSADAVTGISLFGIDAWFTQAKIYATPLCRITPYDVKSMFWRGQKQVLSFNEFENFLEDLAEFRKIHPDTIVFRLRLCGSPELEARLSHLTVPEGTVDLVVDAFTMNSEDVKEEFLNLSNTPYEEPVCFGGVPRGNRKNKTVKEEKEALKNKAMLLMKKRDPSEKLDPLQRNFIYFSKNSNYYSDGRTIELTQLIKWMKQAEIINGDNISSLDIGFLYKRLYALTWKIYYDDLLHFIRELASWKEVSRKVLLQKMRRCTPPASSSVSIISLTLPESLLAVLKSALNDYAGDYEENRDLYEPTAADGPFGHTPNSRNLHFQNGIEERLVSIHTNLMGVKKRSLNGPQKHGSMMIATRRKSMEIAADKEEAFSEEKRGGKDHSAKRWHDAYPIGGADVNYRVRVEAELEKLMYGPDRMDDDSSDEEDRIKKRLNRTYDVIRTPHASIPLEDQFEKFKRYGEYGSDEDGVTLRNIELWFTLAGLLVKRNSLFTVKDLEDTFKQFRFAQERSRLDYDKFLTFIDALANSAKKKTNAREIRERLARCGPPRAPVSASPIESPQKSRNPSDTPEPPQPLLASREESISKSHSKDEENLLADENFKARFQEYARFGEPTFPEAYSVPGLSMLNVDKWYRQANLLQYINRGDVDVFYTQLFPNKHRINLQEFLKLTRELYATVPKSAGISHEQFMNELYDCGPPHISDLPAGASTAPSLRAPSRSQSIQGQKASRNFATDSTKS